MRKVLIEAVSTSGLCSEYRIFPVPAYMMQDGYRVLVKHEWEAEERPWSGIVYPTEEAAINRYMFILSKKVEMRLLSSVRLMITEE